MCTGTESSFIPQSHNALQQHELTMHQLPVCNSACRRKVWTLHQPGRHVLCDITQHWFNSSYHNGRVSLVGRHRRRSLHSYVVAPVGCNLRIGGSHRHETINAISLLGIVRTAPFSTTPSKKDETPSTTTTTTTTTNLSNNVTDIPNSSKTSDPPVQTWWFRYFPDHLHPYIRLARLDKPIGTWLLLWPCYWSTAVAASPGALPDLSLMALFGVGAVVMRGAGCTINDMWDQPFDRHVARTQSRPLAGGALTQTQAAGFLALQMSTGCAILLSLPNTWYCFQWGVASLPLVATYPLLKRVTNWPQLGLGLVFNWGAWMGWAATYGAMNWSVITPLYLSGITWTLCYDTIYAHQDKDDDAKLGLKSTALYFGQHTKPVLHLFALATYLNWYLVGCSEAFHPKAPIIDAVATSVAVNSDSSLIAATDLLSPELLLHYASVPDLWYLVGTTAAYGHLVWQIQTADLDQPNNLATRFRSNTMVGGLVFASMVAAKLNV